MEFFDVVENRHSVRKFKEKEIEEEKLKKILNAVRRAPSAGNLEAYEIVVVRDHKTKAALAEAAYGQEVIAKAPVVLIFFANQKRSSSKYGEKGKEFYSIQDATIAASYAQLAVTATGLASVWVGGFEEEEVVNLLKAQKGMKPVAIIPIGYADEKPYITERRELDEFVHEEHL
jgi:nitroreductase